MGDGTLTQLHGFFGGIRWKLTRDGVLVEGSSVVERTAGAPTTVTHAWETYAAAVNRAAEEYDVYCELIVATMCTETSAHPDARRNEPGWISDHETPGKVSLGLMQTLISTARAVLHDASIDGNWLLVPANSIRAGTAYIAQQRADTRLDPPCVASAYNAGGLYRNDGADNRWKLRQFPIGTGQHCDRFVKWFNDAAAVLKDHPTRPARSLGTFLGAS